MKKITDKVKSFEDACSVLGIEPKVPDFSFLPEPEAKAHLAHFKLIIIAKALNEGWVPDWSNGKWDKWFVWFRFNNDSGSSSASRFSFFGSDRRASGSVCGSRLCFKSRELAEYAAKQFIDIYQKTFII